MLYTLLVPFAEDFQIFNLFRYLTFRAGGAVLTAMFIWFVFGRQFINWLRALQIDGQPIRRDGPLSHINKRGTPTMGGMLILLAVSISTLLWADLSNIYVWIVMLVTLGFGLVGFVDDMRKMIRRSSKGLSPALRLFVQFSITAVAVAMVMHEAAAHYETHLALPFVKDFMLNLGWFYIPFAMIVVVGASNAVNLTDGLDGLAIVPIMIVACGLGIISYVVGNAVFADYLQVHPMMGAGELVIFSAAVLGAGLGFLWYNAPPAMVFMGDTGSLSLGAALGMISVITKHEIVLAIMGGLFVLEAVSVIVQVLVHRLTGQRIFLMAPIHHHFEKKGWAEPTVVIRFWIIAFVLALVALSTLKLR